MPQNIAQSLRHPNGTGCCGHQRVAPGSAPPGALPAQKSQRGLRSGSYVSRVTLILEGGKTGLPSPAAAADKGAEQRDWRPGGGGHATSEGWWHSGTPSLGAWDAGQGPGVHPKGEAGPAPSSSDTA